MRDKIRVAREGETTLPRLPLYFSDFSSKKIFKLLSKRTLSARVNEISGAVEDICARDREWRR